MIRALLARKGCPGFPAAILLTWNADSRQGGKPEGRGWTLRGVRKTRASSSRAHTPGNGNLLPGWGTASALASAMKVKGRRHRRRNICQLLLLAQVLQQFRTFAACRRTFVSKEDRRSDIQ